MPLKGPNFTTICGEREVPAIREGDFNLVIDGLETKGPVVVIGSKREHAISVKSVPVRSMRGVKSGG